MREGWQTRMTLPSIECVNQLLCDHSHNASLPHARRNLLRQAHAPDGTRVNRSLFGAEVSKSSHTTTPNAVRHATSSSFPRKSNQSVTRLQRGWVRHTRSPTNILLMPNSSWKTTTASCVRHATSSLFSLAHSRERIRVTLTSSRDAQLNLPTDLHQLHIIEASIDRSETRAHSVAHLTSRRSVRLHGCVQEPAATRCGTPRAWPGIRARW